MEGSGGEGSFIKKLKIDKFFFKFLNKFKNVVIVKILFKVKRIIIEKKLVKIFFVNKGLKNEDG